MNMQQRNYALALAAVQVLEAEEKACESVYCLQNGYVDEHGNPATRIYQIQDDAVFDAANDDFSSLNESLYTRLYAAKDALRDAENALIDFGLSILPKAYARERELLARKAKEDSTLRRKLIDNAFKLDTRTIPRAWR